VSVVVPPIDVLAAKEGSFREEIASLESGRIDPTFLYVTPRQTELWRQVFLKHSPIHGNPEFARIYRDAFAKAVERLLPEKIWLIGLGCGTGTKELELYSSLKKKGGEVTFSAIDVSRDLVTESARKLTEAGAGSDRHLVCDLTESAALGGWLTRHDYDRPRWMTFFGLVPNLAPEKVARIFRAVLRPGDVLLVSAHLAPVRSDGEEELQRAMTEVLPQYDNAETLKWIGAMLEEWDLAEQVNAPKMTIGQIEEAPAFVAEARWKSAEPFEKWGHRFTPHPEKPLRLFSSLRYTPLLFENFLLREGFAFELLAITPCRQEAIWAVRA
jgi:SAM-dependent methyltransferase